MQPVLPVVDHTHKSSFTLKGADLLEAYDKSIKDVSDIPLKSSTATVHLPQCEGNWHVRFIMSKQQSLKVELCRTALADYLPAFDCKQYVFTSSAFDVLPSTAAKWSFRADSKYILIGESKTVLKRHVSADFDISISIEVFYKPVPDATVAMSKHNLFFHEMIGNPTCADVQIALGNDESICAHSFMLARCPVFKQQFRSVHLTFNT